MCRNHIAVPMAQVHCPTNQQKQTVRTPTVARAGYWLGGEVPPWCSSKRSTALAMSMPILILRATLPTEGHSPQLKAYLSPNEREAVTWVSACQCSNACQQHWNESLTNANSLPSRNTTSHSPTEGIQRQRVGCSAKV